MAPPGAGPPSPRGSDRGEGARPARPHVPARPTFCMGAYPEQLQDKDVRGDMLRSQTIIGILAEALDLKDKRGLLERSKSRGIRAPSLTGGSLEEDKDDPELFAPDTDSQFAKRRKMIHRVLKDDIEKELGNKVEFKKVPPSDNRLRKIFKVTGSELKVLINAVKNEPADCFDVEVKRLLLQFPDLVRLRLKEELDVDSLLTSTSTAQRTKGNKSMTTHQKHTETRQNEVCVEKWRDEWGAVEVTLEFERHEWIADRGDKVIKKGVYPRLLSIDVRFDLPRYTRRDHGAHGPTGATGTQTWTPPLQAGSRDFDVVNQWKERLLSELLSELAAQRSGLPQDVKEGRTVAKGKMDELYRSAAAELVVQSVLQAIEERGSQLMRRWRLERPPDPRFPDPGDLLRLHAIHADGGEQTSKHAANDYDMSKNQYNFVQLNVDRPVDEREATQVWDMVMQLVTKFGDKTAEMRQELRAKLNQLADPDNRLEQKPNGEWPSRKVPDPYVRRLVNQRRRAKDLDLDGRTIHTEGTLLYFAMRAKVPHQVLDELLEHGADPEALQSLHPLGIHQAVLRAPILYFAKDVEQVQTLIENDADTESKSCLNFFTHTTTLWTCCFDKNESVLDQLLNYGADPNARGFHPDHPPLSGLEDRCTALEMAARMGMSQRAKELICRDANFKVNLATTFSTAPPELVREMARFGAVETPKSLLTEDIVRSTHPSVLKTVYSEVAKSVDAVEKLRKQVQNMGSDHVVRFLIHLIREAPLAAGTFLDEVLLQTPIVKEKSRNPLPQTAAIQKDDQMNVTYEPSRVWDFDYEVAESMMPWQEKFIYPGSSSSCNNAQFTDVKILDVPGIIRYELFLEMEMLSYEARVDLFLQCTSLRAIVVCTWNRWSRMVHVVDVACLVGQITIILLWLVTLKFDDYARAMGASTKYAIIVCCWSVFTGTVLPDVVLELPFLVSSLGSLKRRASSSQDSGSMEHFKSFSKRAVVLSLNLCLSITSWNSWEDTPTNQYRTFMALALYTGYWHLMVELSRFHGLGEHLLPILNSFSMTAMKTMLLVITLSWISFMLWSVIEFHGEDDDGGTVTLWQLLVESFLSVWVEVGESTFFPGEYVGFRFMYCHVVGAMTFVFVNIIMMNIFIGICGECYAHEKSKVDGSLVTSKLGICQRTIAQRRFWLGRFSTRFNNEATAVIQRTAVGCSVVLATLFIAATAARSWDVVPIVLAVTVASLIALLKLFVILRNTKKKPADAKPGERWWIDHNYIWVCTPKECHEQVDDRPDEALEHPRLFVVYSGGGLTARDSEGKDKIIRIDGMYRQESHRNGRPQYFRFSPEDDRSAPEIRIYWKEEFCGSGDLGQWELTVRDNSVDRYKKPTAEFCLRGCTSPLGRGMTQWRAVNEDDVSGHLFVMTSQDFSAYQQLYGAGHSGSRAGRRSSRTGERVPPRSPTTEPAEAEASAPEAGGTEGRQTGGSRDGRTDERRAPPEWLRRLLAGAQLDADSIDSAPDAEAYLSSAAAWVRREQVTERQLREDGEALEELASAMGLGKYPRRRLQQALARAPEGDRLEPDAPAPSGAAPAQAKGEVQGSGLPHLGPPVDID